MNYKKARKLSNVFGLTGAGLVVLMLLLNVGVAPMLILGTAGLILIGIGVVITFVNYRCPHCHALLPTRTVAIPAFCPSCGKDLNGKTDIND